MTNHANERHKTADYLNLEKIIGWCDGLICLGSRLILFVFSLYCSQRLVTDRLVEIDIFGQPERLVWPTN